MPCQYDCLCLNIPEYHWKAFLVVCNYFRYFADNRPKKILPKVSPFSKVQQAEAIEVFHKNQLCNEDPSPNKVNLTVGAYRTETGDPWVLPVVKDAEKQVANDVDNHEYLPVLGHEGFRRAATELILGEESSVLKEGRAFGVQCLSGTGALRVGAEFLHRVLGIKTIYISRPTWGNHKLVFKYAGFDDIREYTYWDAKNRNIDFAGLIADLKNAPTRSVIVLHGCAHNPTGIDPTKDQWQEIADVVQKRNLFPFFDVAYQGFASGNPDVDAYAVRLFAEKNIEMFVAQSFAKNFGLYNERVGNLTVVVEDKKNIPKISAQFQIVVRANWSNPPSHGARIVHLVLTDPVRKDSWLGNIKQMATRIMEMRAALRADLEASGAPGSWKHVTDQIGMFSYTGLIKAHVNRLIVGHHVYLLSDGRISICGLTPTNVQYVARAITETLKHLP